MLFEQRIILIVYVIILKWLWENVSPGDKSGAETEPRGIEEGHPLGVLVTSPSAVRTHRVLWGWRGNNGEEEQSLK
jgi:hypothetical protein